MNTRDSVLKQTAELRQLQDKYMDMRQQQLDTKEEALVTKEAELAFTEKELNDPSYVAKLLNNDPRYLALLADQRSRHERIMKVLADAEKTLAYVRGGNAAVAEDRGYSEGLEAASKMFAEKRKKEQAEEQQAEEQQARSEQRSMKMQNQANKRQKHQRQNWSAAVDEDNKKFSTPKGSGSKSRGR